MAADPWGWLDESAEQRWIDVRIEGYGRTITYSVPDRSGTGAHRPRIWPPLESGETAQEIAVPLEAFAKPSLPLGQYLWDRWWGGFLKDSGHDFSLNVRVERAEDETLLGLTLEERLRRPVAYRKAVYSKPNWESQKRGEYFFDRYWVKPFESSTGHVWVAQNNPIVTHDHVYYSIPISDHHILEFSFFVRDRRYDWKDDPEWNARRWGMRAAGRWSNGS
ncbi:MAG: hypothetical protein P8Y52_09670, partial [Xanthomonadales bacterium]